MAWVPGGNHTDPDAGKVLAESGAYTTAAVAVHIAFILGWTGVEAPQVSLRAGRHEQIFNPQQTPFVCPLVGPFYVGIGESVKLVNRNAYTGEVYVSLFLSP